MKLQTILFPDPNICNDEALYLHKEKGFVCFDGCFNLFYLEKHHKYCDIDRLNLELAVRGVKRINIMHDRDVVSSTVVDASGEDSRRLSIELPYDRFETGVLWFAAQLVDSDADFKVQGHFEGVIVKKPDRTPIGLGVNICTYRREQYVVRNMKSLLTWKEKRDIDGNVPEAARHMHVFIVDNAKTLMDYQEFKDVVSGLTTTECRELVDVKGGSHITDCQESEYAKADSSSFIDVIPNSNTGGTGGFSRGMIEAMNRGKVLGITHLLMMDDDAVFDPEVFVRLYGFLSALKEEYKEISVGGALMREDYPYIQHAAGEWYGHLKVHNDHLLTDLRNYENCVSSWMTGTDGEKRYYGAWWCCCYHMSAITRENLPFPIFVHHDDIQFGLKQMKQGRGIVFLNGICVWHQGFETVFPGVKQYYNMRNALITSALYEPSYLRKKLKRWTIRRYIGLLISYRYADCEFVYRGLFDFLKGRKWLMASDPEEIHRQLMDLYKLMCPFEKMEVLPDGISDKLTLDQIKGYYSRERFNAPLFKKLTFNGWILPGYSDLKVITPFDSPWECYRYKRILLYEPGSGKGCVMKRGSAELFKGIFRIVKMSFAIDVWKLKGGRW